MKLVSFLRDGVQGFGGWRDDGIVDIAAAWPGPNPPSGIAEMFARGQECIDRVRGLVEGSPDATPTHLVKLLAPIPRPGKMLALAGNYTKHIIEAGLKLGLSESPATTTVPRPFLKPSSCVTASDEQIPLPVYSEQMDYELELGIVIGRAARCVSEENALDYVGGYTIVNDVSARSVTVAEGRSARPWDEFYDWLLGKWSDGFCPMGPWLLTADEVPDIQNLDMELKVNSQIRQQANTAQMIHSVAFIVSFMSHVCTLEPGDVIASGTPHGVGLATGRYLREGDLIEATISGLGTLRNTVGPRPGPLYTPLERR